MEEVFGSQYFEKIGHPEHATYESFRRAYRAMKKRARKLVPTKFEDPDWYSVILEIAEKIDRIVKKHGYDLSRSKPLFGTLPSGNVNAMAVTIPGSFHRLILIEEGLFSFANLMVKAVTAVFSSRDGEGGMVEFSLDEERVEKNLADSAEIQERFLDVIMSYLVNGHPAFAKSYLPDRRSSAFSSYLCNSFEVFVLAHEYGHLIFNSRTDKKDLQQQEREMNPNWIEEFVADTKGLEILIGVKMRGEKGPGSIKGKQSPNKPPQRRAPPPAVSPAGKSMPGGAAVGGSLGSYWRRVGMTERALNEVPPRLGGFLVLISIGVILSPFGLGLRVLEGFLFFGTSTWDKLTDPASRNFVLHFDTFSYGEFLGSSVLWLASIYLFVLWRIRRKDFRLWYIGISIASLVYLISDIIFANILFPNLPAFGPGTAIAMLWSAIAIPYMIVSKRVRAYFVNDDSLMLLWMMRFSPVGHTGRPKPGSKLEEQDSREWESLRLDYDEGKRKGPD